MKLIFTLFFCVLIAACNSQNSQNRLNQAGNAPTATDGTSAFEKRIYLKIDRICSGKVYTDKNNRDVFYRILIVPEEENIMLLAENIEIGEEGGAYKLIKTIRLTDDGSRLPKWGLNTVDSLKFTDSVTVQGYFNGKKRAINLEK